MNNKIAFVDSGVGGLIFGIECLIEMKDRLISENKFLEILHIGDEINMPYGLKNSEQLKKLVENLVNICTKKGFCNIIFACNTASTILTEKLISEYRKKDINIISILDISANKLYERAAINSEDQINIGLFATRRTIESKEYVKRINNLHNKLGFERKCNVFDYSPIEWEQKVENCILGDEKKEIIKKHLEIFEKEIGVKNFHKISTLGLFCTHYPYLAEEISNYFKEKNIDIELVKQGALFADLALSFCIQRSENKINNQNYYKIESITTDKNSKFLYKKIIDLMYKDFLIEFKCL